MALAVFQVIRQNSIREKQKSGFHAAHEFNVALADRVQHFATGIDIVPVHDKRIAI